VSFEPHPIEVSATEFTARQSRSFNSAKAEAIEFLRDLFGSALQLRVRHIEAETRAAGLLKPRQALSQSRALRDARLALGLKVAREGFGKDGAWVWAKPGARVEKQGQGRTAQSAKPTQAQGAKPAQTQPTQGAEPPPRSPTSIHQSFCQSSYPNSMPSSRSKCSFQPPDFDEAYEISLLAGIRHSSPFGV
jgi:hypothetical protein